MQVARGFGERCKLRPRTYLCAFRARKSDLQVVMILVRFMRRFLVAWLPGSR